MDGDLSSSVCAHAISCSFGAWKCSYFILWIFWFARSISLSGRGDVGVVVLLFSLPCSFCLLGAGLEEGRGVVVRGVLRVFDLGFASWHLGVCGLRRY